MRLIILEVRQMKRKKNYPLKEKVGDKMIKDKILCITVQEKIKSLKEKFESKICVKLPSVLQQRKKMVKLSYELDFKKSHISIKARPIQMNERHLKFCKTEIGNLLKKKLKSKSTYPWSWTSFTWKMSLNQRHANINNQL